MSEIDEKPSAYYGHKTMLDGTRVLLTKEEADSLVEAIEAEDAQRAEQMPTARDALGTLISAEQRLQDLGWWKGCGLRVKRGDECAVAENGSTGMWHGRVDGAGEYVMYAGGVRHQRDVWMKPLSDLTDDERSWIAKCDAYEDEAFCAEVSRWGPVSPPAPDSPDDGQPDESKEWSDYDPDC